MWKFLVKLLRGDPADDLTAADRPVASKAEDVLGFNDKNPWLMMQSLGNLTSPSSKRLMPHFEVIRRLDQWVSLGFSVRLDEYGFPVADKRRNYRFRKINRADQELMPAAGTGKRAVSHPNAVFPYYAEAGCALDEFFELRDDVRDFCIGKKLYKDGNATAALPFLEAAYLQNTSDLTSIEEYFPARVDAGDLSGVEEAVASLRGQLDRWVHSGYAARWIKLLARAGEKERAARVMHSFIAELTTSAAEPDLKNHRGLQPNAWARAKLDDLRKQLGDTGRRLENFLP